MAADQGFWDGTAAKQSGGEQAQEKKEGEIRMSEKR